MTTKQHTDLLERLEQLNRDTRSLFYSVADWKPRSSPAQAPILRALDAVMSILEAAERVGGVGRK